MPCGGRSRRSGRPRGNCRDGHRPSGRGGTVDGLVLASGGGSYRLSPARIAVAAGLWALIGLAVGWPAAGVWGAAALAAEWPLRAVTKPMSRGETLSAAERWICFGAWFAMVSV